MPYVPPWEDVTPQAFVQAAEGGAQIGQAAKDEQDRVRLALAQQQLEEERTRQSAATTAAQLGLQGREQTARERAAAAQEALEQAKLGQGASELGLEREKLGQSAQESQQEQAVNLLKATQPEVVTPYHGGVVTIDPVTGQSTVVQPPPPQAQRYIQDKDGNIVDANTGEVVYSSDMPNKPPSLYPVAKNTDGTTKYAQLVNGQLVPVPVMGQSATQPAPATPTPSGKEWYNPLTWFGSSNPLNTNTTATANLPPNESTVIDANPLNTASTATSPAKPSGKAIKDPATGQTWNYLGNMADPTQDDNPENWVLAQ